LLQPTSGSRLRTTAVEISERIDTKHARAGLGSVHPHVLRAAFIMAALDAGGLAAGRTTRRPARKSKDYDDLRPAPTELRSPRRLRRRRIVAGG